MKRFVNYLDHYKENPDPGSKEDHIAISQMIQKNYTDYKIGPISNSYEEWQTKHEVFSLKKVPFTIEFSVENLDDLINLIYQYPVNAEYEYNIDLKSLHNIKPELIALQTMVGLKTLKQSVVDQLLYFIQNLHTGAEGDFKHTVLLGPPGTGKTEVARLMGKMYSKIGVLKNNIFKKVTRADLIAGYLGQTAIKTQKVIDSCLGGVLFIDEAYSLGDPTQSDMFSKECIDTLCESLSFHKDNLMVIIAGYEHSLKECFFNTNPGLESRFLWRFSMEPYSPKELNDIFFTKIKQSGWTPPENVESAWFEKRKDNFRHYGRDMESLFTYTKIKHGRRVFGKSGEQKKCLKIEDLEKGYQVFLKNREVKKQSVILDMYL